MSVGAQPTFRAAIERRPPDALDEKRHRISDGQDGHREGAGGTAFDRTPLKSGDRSSSDDPGSNSATRRRSASRGLQRYGVPAAYGRGYESHRGASVASSQSRRRMRRELAPGPQSVAMEDALASVRSHTLHRSVAGDTRMSLARDATVDASHHRPSTAMVRQSIGADLRTGTQML